MTLSKSNRSLLALTIALVGLIGYSFTDAQTWTPPIATPPGGNVAAPVNVGPTDQTKSGNLTLTNSLGTNNLNVIGSVRFANGAPWFHWNDNDDGDRDFYQHVNDNQMYFLADRNNNGIWDAGDWGGAHPMTMVAGASPINDSVSFSNDVNAGRNVNANGYVWSRQFWGDNLEMGNRITGREVYADRFCNRQTGVCATIEEMINPRPIIEARFNSRFQSLTRNTEFLNWANQWPRVSLQWGSFDFASVTWRDSSANGWGAPGNGDTHAVMNKLCQFYMDGGYVSDRTVNMTGDDRGSDNGNTLYTWRGTHWEHGREYGTRGSVDIINVYCKGYSVLPRGAGWRI